MTWLISLLCVIGAAVFLYYAFWAFIAILFAIDLMDLPERKL